MTPLVEIIEEIRRLPHFRRIRCRACGEERRVHALQIYSICACGTQVKCRSFGASGSEIEDVIDAVLEWMGAGEELQAVLRRQAEIQADA